MKLISLTSYLFIFAIIQSHNYLTEDQIQERRKNALSVFPNLLDYNDDSTFEQFKQKVSEGFNYVIKSDNISSALVEFFGLNLDALIEKHIDQSNSDTIKQVDNLIKKLVNDRLEELENSTEVKKSDILELFEKVRPIYISLFLYELKQNIQNRNENVNNYINFSNIVYDHLTEKNTDKSFIPKKKGILTEISNLTNEVSAEVVNNLSDNISEIYQIYFFLYQQKGQFLANQAQTLIYTFTRQELKPKQMVLLFNRLEEILSAYYQISENGSFGQDMLENTLKLEQEYINDQKLNGEKVGTVLQKFVNIQRKLNRDSSDFIHKFFAEQTVQYEEETFIVKLLQEKLKTLNAQELEYNFDQIIQNPNPESRKNYIETIITLSDIVLFTNLLKHNKEILNVVLDHIYEIHQLGTDILTHIDIIDLLGYFVCDHDMKFQQELYELVNQFRYAMKDQGVLENRLFSYILFNKFLDNKNQESNEQFQKRYPLYKMYLMFNTMGIIQAPEITENLQNLLIWEVNNVSHENQSFFKNNLNDLCDNGEIKLQSRFQTLVLNAAQNDYETKEEWKKDLQQKGSNSLWDAFWTGKFDLVKGKKWSNIKLNFNTYSTEVVQKKYDLSNVQFNIKFTTDENSLIEKEKQAKREIEKEKEDQILQNRSEQQQDTKIIPIVQQNKGVQEQEQKNIIKVFFDEPLNDKEKEILSSPNLRETLEQLSKNSEDGTIRFDNPDGSITEIVYVQIIPPSDCQKNYLEELLRRKSEFI